MPAKENNGNAVVAVYSQKEAFEQPKIMEHFSYKSKHLKEGYKV